MRKLYIRWLLPIVMLLIVATVLALAPLVTNAAKKTDRTQPTPTPVVTPTVPVVTPTVPTVSPNAYWQF